MAEIAALTGALGFAKGAIKPLVYLVLAFFGMALLFIGMSWVSSVHATTAVIFAIIGLLMAWLAGSIKKEETPNYLFVIPVLVGISGYICENYIGFKLHTVYNPSYIVLKNASITADYSLTVTGELIALILLITLSTIGVIAWYKKKYR